MTEKPATDAAKRAIDVVLSATLLAGLTPLLALVAVAIRIESPGPVFFRCVRMGRHQRPFQMVKFRSMVRDAATRGAITAPGDSRITRIGAWMRLLKIDELPQLWNVLAGQMSLVGPRPQDCQIVEKYYTADQKRVFEVRPGLTGLGQVRFFPDMTSEVPAGVDPELFYVQSQLPRKLAVDLEYVDRLSIALDVAILARTAYCIFLKAPYLAIVRPPPELGGREKEEREARNG